MIPMSAGINSSDVTAWLENPGKGFYESGQPIDVPEIAGHGQEISKNQPQDSSFCKDLEDRVVSNSLFRCQLCVQFVDEPVALFFGKPARLRGPVGQVKKS